MADNITYMGALFKVSYLHIFSFSLNCYYYYYYGQIVALRRWKEKVLSLNANESMNITYIIIIVIEWIFIFKHEYISLYHHYYIIINIYITNNIDV